MRTLTCLGSINTLLWRCWSCMCAISYWKAKSRSITRTLRSVRTRILRNGRIGRWLRWRMFTWWRHWNGRRKKSRCSSCSSWDCSQSTTTSSPPTRGTCSSKSYSNEHILSWQPVRSVGHFHRFRWFRWPTVLITATITWTITWSTLNRRRTHHQRPTSVADRSRTSLYWKKSTWPQHRISSTTCERNPNFVTRNSCKSTSKSSHHRRRSANFQPTQKCPKTLKETSNSSSFHNNTNPKSETYANCTSTQVHVPRITIPMMRSWQSSL